MIDTFSPLLLSAGTLGVEDETYWSSWDGAGTCLARRRTGARPSSRTGGGGDPGRARRRPPRRRRPVYRARRDAIAALALTWSPGEPVPDVDYTEVEHETWRTVCRELGRCGRTRRRRRSCTAAEELALPADHVPQLAEVSDRSAPLTGFRYLPVAGLAPLRTLLQRASREDVFWSTQYLRHHSQPLYTPEPDLCHEVLGHANQLADPAFAGAVPRSRRPRRPGRDRRGAAPSSPRSSGSRSSSASSREGASSGPTEPDCCRASVRCRSSGHAEVRPVDWAEMGTQAYDITHYQDVLYEVPSIDWLASEFTLFLDGYDDETHSRLTSRCSNGSRPWAPLRSPERQAASGGRRATGWRPTATASSASTCTTRIGRRRSVLTIGPDGDGGGRGRRM